MSPSPHDQPLPPVPLQSYVPAPPLEAGLTMIVPPEPAGKSTGLLLLVALLAAAGLLARGFLWQKFSNMQE